MCLGILSRGPASGYEIKRELEDGMLSCLFDAGFGSIYPALKKLHDSGFIELTTTPENGRGDAKYYNITSTGVETFKQSLMQKRGKDKIKSPTMLAMFFGSLLTEDYLVRIQKEYLHFYQDFLANILECKKEIEKASPSEKYIMGMGEAVLNAKIKYMEENPIEDFFDKSR